MKFAEINAIYTQKVAEYLANGYIINSNTMAGHQGEIAKIDLRKDNDVIRIMIDSANHYSDHCFCSTVSIIVGRCIEKDIIETTDQRDLTIWNNRLEVIEQKTFYRMQKNYRDTEWYIEGEEGLEAIKRGHGRREYEPDLHPRMDYSNNDAVKAAILPAVRRHLEKPRLKAERIASIIRTWDEGRYNYYVTTKGGSRVTLH